MKSWVFKPKIVRCAYWEVNAHCAPKQLIILKEICFFFHTAQKSHKALQKKMSAVSDFLWSSLHYRVMLWRTFATAVGCIIRGFPISCLTPVIQASVRHLQRPLGGQCAHSRLSKWQLNRKAWAGWTTENIPLIARVRKGNYITTPPVWFKKRKRSSSIGNFLSVWRILDSGITPVSLFHWCPECLSPVALHHHSPINRITV